MSIYNFTILDESSDLIVVDKPAPLQVYARKPTDPPGLLEGLRELLIYDLANGATLSIINRLDRETSGVVLIAKNHATASRLHKSLQNRRARKTYHAIIHGTADTPDWTCDAPLRRRGEFIEDAEVWVEQAPHPHGKPARTTFRVLQQAGEFSLIEARPETGRTHQIRVHLKETGHPIAGDKLYGIHGRQPYLELTTTGKITTPLPLPRQALHCHRMEIPGIGIWTAPTPPEFLALLEDTPNIPQI